MPDNQPAPTRKLNSTRIILLIFLGLAAVMITTTILGTLRNMDAQIEVERQQREGAVPASGAPVPNPAPETPAPAAPAQQ